MLDVILHPKRDRSLRRRHPWVLSGAVARTEGTDEPGAWARVLSHEGEVLGHGHWSPRSPLRVRLLAFGKDAVDEPTCLQQAVERALGRRSGETARALIGETDAVRLVNAEGDGLPGLVVDRYADTLVIKRSSPGMLRARGLVDAALQQGAGAAHAWERFDRVAARREGFAVPASEGEALWGEPPARTRIRERSRGYEVDLRGGQKTGFYLDQRESRDRVESLAAGRRVLDLFGYTGGFTVAALRGGAAAIDCVDSSVDALALAEANAAANTEDGRAPKLAADTLRFLRADAFAFLRAETRRYDLLVVDPPPLARGRRDVDRAARAYKDLVLHALRRAAPEALLLCFACSHHVGAELFRKIVFGAALDAHRRLQVLDEPGAPPDHPVSIDHPEGRYLSGLLLRVDAP